VERRFLAARLDWERRVESVGLTYHHTGANIYWDETVYYRFNAAEVDQLEEATDALHQLCLTAVQHIIDHGRFAELHIPPEAVPVIKASWEAGEPTLYGRFDIAFDGQGPPKLLEYNADTPTALVEAAVAQWYWLQDVFPKSDQFNSIHERLVDAWKAMAPDGPVHFGYLAVGDGEEEMTATYLRDTAEQAGLATVAVEMQDIGWDAGAGRFVDQAGEPIRWLFKLYPWEWLVREDFGANALATYQQVRWVEPIWKMLLSNKGILPILWELNPGHPNLLPAYFETPHGLQHYVRKPLLGREGANVTYVSPKRIATSGGRYDGDGYIYQGLGPVPEMGGKYPVLGTWVVAGQAAGLGIRESNGPITDNSSRFIPHLFD